MQGLRRALDQAEADSACRLVILAERKFLLYGDGL